MRVEMKQQRGLAAVLVIIIVFILVVSIMTMRLAGKRTSRADIDLKTSKELSEAKAAILGFAILNSRLPRPRKAAMVYKEHLYVQIHPIALAPWPM
jgi:uncharacterized membrane protein